MRDATFKSLELIVDAVYSLRGVYVSLKPGYAFRITFVGYAVFYLQDEDFEVSFHSDLFELLFLVLFFQSRFQ